MRDTFLLTLLFTSYGLTLGHIINPHNYEFTMLPQPCDKENLLISVHSGADLQQRRMMLRTTWLNPRILNPLLNMNIKVVFFTGLPLGANFTVRQSKLNYEQEIYNDIVQENFNDSYHNNTHKAMSHLKWVAINCKYVEFIIKIDDDALVKLRRFPAIIEEIRDQIANSNGRAYFGNSFNKQKSHPMRNKESKWHIPTSVFAGKIFPMWMQGLFYVLTPNIAQELFSTALRTPYLFTDDVYIGILAAKAGNITYYKLNRHFMPQDQSPHKLAQLELDFYRDNFSIFHLSKSSMFFLFSLYNPLPTGSVDISREDFHTRLNSELAHDLLEVEVHLLDEGLS